MIMRLPFHAKGLWRMSNLSFSEQLAPAPHGKQRAMQLFRHFAVGQFAEQRILLLCPRKLSRRTKPLFLADFPLRTGWRRGFHTERLVDVSPGTDPPCARLNIR